MRKICPTCRREYTEIENYCSKCGIALKQEPNCCSGKKTALCRDRICADDDLYCSICGSPTIYGLERLREIKDW